MLVCSVMMSASRLLSCAGRCTGVGRRVSYYLINRGSRSYWFDLFPGAAWVEPFAFRCPHIHSASKLATISEQLWSYSIIIMVILYIVGSLGMY